MSTRTTRHETTDNTGYADDIGLSRTIPCADVVADSSMQEEATQLDSWAASYNMIMNGDKSYELIICFARNPPEPPPLILGGTEVPVVDCATYLGFKVHSNLGWDSRCGVSLTAPSGGPVTSPNYPGNYGNNENCEWLITAPEGSIIRLTFDSFYTERNYDFLTIYDGASDHAAKIERLTGYRSQIIPIMSTSNTMFLRFTSSNWVSYQGFQFSYTSSTAGQCWDPGVPANGNRDNNSNFTSGQTVRYTCMDGYQLRGTANITCQPNGTWSGATPTCEGSSATGCGGSLTAPFGGPVTSPNYPSNYGNNENCEWSITVPEGSIIRLTFDSFNTEDGYDFLTIYDGASDNAAEIGRLTGYHAQIIPIMSTSNTLFLRFTSDESESRPGFQFSYSSRTAGQCWDPGVPTNGNRDNNSNFTSGQTVRYTCMDGYPLRGIANITCQPNGTWSGATPTCGVTSATGCGGSLTAPSGGPVTSPNYPDNYGNNENCEWTITLPEGSIIRLTFDSFHTELHSDLLQIYDGPVRPIELTGYRSQIIPIISTSNTMFLRFTSDGSVSRQGFQFSYISSTAGQCWDPGVPTNGNRDNNSNFTSGQTVRYTCMDGYQLRGTANITCQPNGTWSGATPTCEGNK
ncbi:CUB and sushi domain-containing protein 1-like [Branchiostoma floridae x Branchiostoma belcheri]